MCGVFDNGRERRGGGREAGMGLGGYLREERGFEGYIFESEHRKRIKRLHVEEVTVYRKLYGRGEAEPYNRICDEAKPSYILKVYGHF